MGRIPFFAAYGIKFFVAMKKAVLISFWRLVR